MFFSCFFSQHEKVSKNTIQTDFIPLTCLAKVLQWYNYLPAMMNGSLTNWMWNKPEEKSRLHTVPMPRISSTTRKPLEPSAETYGTSNQSTSEEEEITDVIQIGVSNTVFLSIAGLLLTCAIFLLRHGGFLAVINGCFLCLSAIAVAMLELYQPPSVMLVIPFWNSCVTRGLILVWLSVIAMNGFWLAGFRSSSRRP